MSEEQKTVAEIAHAASGYIADGIKSGAVQPLRLALGLMDALIAGDYERVAPPQDDDRLSEMLTQAVRNSKELTQGDVGDENVETSAKPKSRAKSKPKTKPKRAKKSRR